MNRKYTEEQKQFVREHVADRRFPELARMFNERFGTDYRVSQIQCLVYRLGLGNGLNGVGLVERGMPYRFQKGHTPFNKGKKGISFPGMEATQFKKGHVPHNWVPIGSERVTKDGIVQVKVQEGKFQHNWKSKHELIWEEHNGPLPAGHVIIFGDGNRRNFDINNLICVSRAQLVRLNQKRLIQNDADLTRSAVIIADIYNKIGKRKRR